MARVRPPLRIADADADAAAGGDPGAATIGDGHRPCLSIESLPRWGAPHALVHCEKTIYDPAAPEDGLRLLVMRRYPRGVARSRISAWLPHLAPTLPLVRWYHDTKREITARWQRTDPERFGEEIDRFWRTYRRRYLREMKAQRTLIEFLAHIERTLGASLTFLCACPDHRICHRSLLKELVEGARS